MKKVLTVQQTEMPFSSRTRLAGGGSLQPTGWIWPQSHFIQPTELGGFCGISTAGGFTRAVARQRGEAMAAALQGGREHGDNAGQVRSDPHSKLRSKAALAPKHCQSLYCWIIITSWHHTFPTLVYNYRSNTEKYLICFSTAQPNTFFAILGRLSLVIQHPYKPEKYEKGRGIVLHLHSCFY